MNNELAVIEPSSSRAEIDTQVATAKRFTRNVNQFGGNVLAIATASREVAESCVYRLERRNRDGSANVIEGPSIRFAEIALACWGNCRVQARIVEEGKTHIVVQAMAWDLETNNAWSSEVRRNILSKNGHRYSEDMISVTTQAALAIASRNAVLKVIPRALVESLIGHVKRAAAGTERELPERRRVMLEKFARLGVSAEQVLHRLGRDMADQITLDDIASLVATYTAINDGESTVEDEFPRHHAPGEADPVPQTKAERLAKQLHSARRDTVAVAEVPVEAAPAEDYRALISAAKTPRQIAVVRGKCEAITDAAEREYLLSLVSLQEAALSK